MIVSALLWFLILLPGIMLLEAKHSVRKYILSGKLFFAPTHERRLSNKTILFLATWLASLPISLLAFVALVIRWSGILSR